MSIKYVIRDKEMEQIFKDVTEEINSDPILNNDADTSSEVNDAEETERKRKELLLLSSDGEVSKSVAFINKASARSIEKLYAEYEAKRLEKNAEFLCDMLISKFSMVLGGLDAIEKPDEMEKELKNNPLLRKDLKTVMTWLAPIVPFLGVLSGGMTVGKHMWGKKSKAEEAKHDEQAEQDE